MTDKQIQVPADAKSIICAYGVVAICENEAESFFEGFFGAFPDEKAAEVMAATWQRIADHYNVKSQFVVQPVERLFGPQKWRTFKELLESPEKLEQARNLLQGWVDKQGHNRCWYYPETFNLLARLLGVTPSKPPGLPPESEFAAGCDRYRLEQYNQADGFTEKS